MSQRGRRKNQMKLKDAKLRAELDENQAVIDAEEFNGDPQFSANAVQKKL